MKKVSHFYIKKWRHHEWMLIWNEKKIAFNLDDLKNHISPRKTTPLLAVWDKNNTPCCAVVCLPLCPWFYRFFFCKMLWERAEQLTAWSRKLTDSQRELYQSRTPPAKYENTCDDLRVKVPPGRGAVLTKYGGWGERGALRKIGARYGGRWNGNLFRLNQCILGVESRSLGVTVSQCHSGKRSLISVVLLIHMLYFLGYFTRRRCALGSSFCR